MKKTLHFLLLGILSLPLKACSILCILLFMATTANLHAQESVPFFKIEPHRIVITNQNQVLAISIDCPSFILEKQIIGGYSPLKKYGDIRKSEKEPFRIAYSPVKLQGGGQMDIQLFIQWSSKEKLLHKWVKYSVSGIESPVLLKEIILDRLETNDPSLSIPSSPGQSYPVFFPGFFAGVEFPVSSMRMESGRILMAHQPGLRMQPGKWYESKMTVYGVAQKGHEKEAFLSYIAANRPGKDEIHVNYNSWWSAPVPYSETTMLELIKTFELKLFQPYGVSFNSFCIDMGWSDPKSIWSIDTLLFPKRFDNILQAARKMNTNLGLWISPSNMYSPESLDSHWAEQNGYETFVVDSARIKGRGTVCCLGGEHYSTLFCKRLVDIVKKYDIKQLKFDGYILSCPESDHGHEPGELSIERTAEALAETCRQVHRVSPDTWIETTCMGGNPSPWWLFYANSVIGTFGGDLPEGRIPCPIYRESYTSARDFFNIQGATYIMTPISAQEVLGIDHQSMEPFANDAVTTIMRGHLFLPLYINPVYMDGARWKMIADIITWARKNAPLIGNTNVLLPESWKNGRVPKFTDDASTMPYEPYGYAHCMNDRGLIELRNPWIKNSEYILKIDSSTGFSNHARNLNIVSIYPEVRIYARDIRYGDSINIPLAPYETLVVSVSDNESLKGLSNATDLLSGFGRVQINKIEKAIVNPLKTSYSERSDSVLQRTDSLVRIGMEGSVEVKSPQADLLVLIESDNETFDQKGTVYINGNPTPFVTTENRRILPRWKASKRYWVFLKAPLKYGKNVISLKLDLPKSPQKVSVWAWAKKPGDIAPESYPNALPQPEEISLESVNLIEPFATETIYLSPK
ncbi:MAG: hypothetical protein PHF34_04115 [Bacteroidales bacterium]|nr:hypothetical protein [Bacteroidales bacterium]